MDPSRRSRRHGPHPLAVAVGLVLAVAATAGLAGVLRGSAPPVPAANAPAPVATDQCRAAPRFSADPAVVGAALAPGAGAGESAPVALATDGPERGLVLVGGPAQARYQHPTWDDAGYLGAIATDRAGNVYAAPTPRLSLADNPLDGMGVLWRVDSATAELRPFVTLPGAAHARNPFGVLGLFYACDTDTLYAGTVLGSTPSAEYGGVVAVQLPDGAITPILTGRDVLGVLVVRQGDGLVLYAGLARSPAIVAVALDAQGRAAGPATPLIDLADAGATPQERARKLRLVDGALVADLIPFTYALQSSASSAPPLRQATWAWDATTRGWAVQQPARAGR